MLSGDKLTDNQKILIIVFVYVSLMMFINGVLFGLWLWR